MSLSEQQEAKTAKARDYADFCSGEVWVTVKFFFAFISHFVNKKFIFMFDNGNKLYNHLKTCLETF